MNLVTTDVSHDYEDWSFDPNEYDVEVTPAMALFVERIVSNTNGAGGDRAPTEIEATTSHGDSVPLVLTIKWSAGERDDGPLVNVTEALKAAQGIEVAVYQMKSFHEYGTHVSIVSEDTAEDRATLSLDE